MTEILVFFIITSLLTLISKKFKLLPNFIGENHQLFINEKKVPLIGGVLFLMLSIYFFYEKNFTFCFAVFFIFFVGFLSDAGILSSPKIRIFFQTLIITAAVYLLDIKISSTKIIYLDKIIEIKFFSIIFCTFCLMILINGSNFIDGLNGLLLGYCLIILFILAKVNLLSVLQLEKDLLLFLFLGLIIMIFFNYFNFFYLGDGGSYSIGLVIGFLLLSIYDLTNISPFFIILLLWYPCFENLFSIIRKNKLNNSPIIADNMHLHQLLFFYVKKKFFKKDLFSNNFSSILINFYNLIIMIIASTNVYNSYLQVLLITINILLYNILYRHLFIYRFKKK